MVLRLIHTADWHLGKPFRNIAGDAGALLREARFTAVERIARLAAEHDVAAVLVAGDIFDGNHVGARTLQRALAAMRGFSGPWVLLPGNHDAALAASVWTRLPEEGRPDRLIVATRPEPLELADGRLVVLPCPLDQRRTYDDLTEWLDTASTPAASFRVGLAHGSVEARLPEGVAPTNPIAENRSATARLDYLALGDWHSRNRIDDRTWYSGTPESDGFACHDAGHALLVELHEPGGMPTVRPLEVGRHHWQRIRFDVMEGEAALERQLAGPLPARQRLVRLELHGSLDLDARARLDRMLARWHAELMALEVDDDALHLEPVDTDMQRLAAMPLIADVAQAIADRIAGSAGEDRIVAELALRRLHAAFSRLEGGE